MTSASPEPSPQRDAGRWLYILAIFASAFCIFLVQPMVGKRILPWFGGAPAVWTLCLAFYQSTLFLGYAYAHLLIRFAKPSHQLGLHAVAVAAALIALPVLPDESWKPLVAAEPTAPILAMLLANVALPFMLLASTGPLVQAWFSRRYPDRSPYPLYAVSNVGSVLALVSYPLLLEPRLPLSETGTLWSVGFAMTAAAVLACAAMTRGSAPASENSSDAGDDALRIRTTPTVVALWLFLSGTAVVMLMGITNKLCLDVASVPFLWILPLLAYLVTFIVCFASERTYRRTPLLMLFAAGLLLTVGGPLWIPALGAQAQLVAGSIYVQILSFCTLLFASCMIMHGELYRLRPPTRSLTAFYLCVSFGGAMGGIFVGILAPVVFTNYFEFELGLALVVLLMIAACANDRDSFLGANGPSWRWLVVGPLSLVLLGLLSWQNFRIDPDLLSQERSFFGVVRVSQAKSGDSDLRVLTHGSTVHGMQYLDDTRRKLATSYFGKATGVGLALDSRLQGEQTRVGVIGLGIGTLAAYGRSGDFMRFYEIDPAVIRVARDSGEFSYLSDSDAEIELVLGDARISIATEQALDPSLDFDILIVDAFNSDTVPVHLMTQEMFENYVGALATDGLLAFHVSNRHFDLMRLVARMGMEAGLQSITVVTFTSIEHLSLKARWVFLARERNQITRLERDLKRGHRALGIAPSLIRTHFTRLIDVKRVPVWTDDYSDLYSLLKRKW